MWIALYIFIALCSVAITPIPGNDQFWIPKEFVYTVFAPIIIALPLLFDNQKVITFKNKWVAAFLVYTFLGFAYYFYFPLLLSAPDGGVSWNLWNFRPTMNVVLGVFLLITIVENTDDLKRWINVGKFLCWVGFLFSVYALLQWVGVDQIFRGNADWVHVNNEVNRNAFMVTFLSNKFLTASYVTVLSPMCLMFKQFRYKAMYLTMFLAVVLADTAINTFAFVFVFFVYLVFSRNWKGLLISIVLCGGIFSILSNVYSDFLSTSGRFELWQQSVIAPIKEGFLRSYTGFGLGSYALKFKSGNLLAASAHNESVQIFHDGGLIAIVIVFGYLVTLVKRVFFLILRSNSMLVIGYSCGLVAYIITSFGGFPLRIAPLALVLILYIASLESQLQGEQYV